MTKSSMTELKKIRKTVASEFPSDPALQQIHIAQRLIARQAASRGMTIPDYIRSLRKSPAACRRRIG
ncbi:MAG: hypothetical protein NTX53_06875 [candidate division WOR-3 bacterium]|nr:hypothetical protein [candidate division WOR-3 bacterium]